MYNKILGIDAQQQPGILTFFNELLEQYKPRRIIELGTGKGGLSVVLALWCYNNQADFCTFETNHNVIHPNVKYLLEVLGGDIYENSVFSDVNFINVVIQGEGRTLLLCDNGNKKKELEIFAPLLKFGDIVMAHDYCTSRKVFESNKIYKGRSCELIFDDIKNIVEENNLILKRCNPMYMWVVMEKL